MRHPLLALVIAIAGMSGTLQATKPDSESWHRVRKGETAAKIAKAHGLSVAQLKTLNPGQNLAKLSVGNKVIVSKEHPGKPSSAKALVVDSALPAIAESQPSQPLPPIQALPAIPTPGPLVLVHLERLLPATLQPAHPLSLSSLPVKASNSGNLADIQAILPYAEATEPSATPALAEFEPLDLAHLDLLWPVETRTISSAWGPRMRSRTVRIVKQNIKKKVRVRYRGEHKGIDLTAPTGTDVYSALDGIVITSGKHRQMGNYVVVDHGNGVITVYGHHKRNFVRVGDVVRRGQKIAEVGRTGNATGPHLHFELRIDNVHQNPLPYLNDAEEIPAELMAQNHAALPLSRR